FRGSRKNNHQPLRTPMRFGFSQTAPRVLGTTTSLLREDALGDSTVPQEDAYRSSRAPCVNSIARQSSGMSDRYQSCPGMKPLPIHGPAVLPGKSLFREAQFAALQILSFAHIVSRRQFRSLRIAMRHRVPLGHQCNESAGQRWLDRYPYFRHHPNSSTTSEILNVVRAAALTCGSTLVRLPVLH